MTIIVEKSDEIANDDLIFIFLKKNWRVSYTSVELAGILKLKRQYISIILRRLYNAGYLIRKTQMCSIQNGNTVNKSIYTFKYDKKRWGNCD